MSENSMPRYKCHKEVHAVKIAAIQPQAGDRFAIIPEGFGTNPFMVGLKFMTKHDPRPGGYYVLYEDGYESYSPAKAFEAGYSRMDGSETKTLGNTDVNGARKLEASGAGAWLPDIEDVSSRAHDAWMASKLRQGVTSRKSETGEELMVEYESLSEEAKQLDRCMVEAVYAAILSCR